MLLGIGTQLGALLFRGPRTRLVQPDSVHRRLRDVRHLGAESQHVAFRSCRSVSEPLLSSRVRQVCLQSVHEWLMTSVLLTVDVWCRPFYLWDNSLMRCLSVLCAARCTSVWALSRWIRWRATCCTRWLRAAGRARVSCCARTSTARARECWSLRARRSRWSTWRSSRSTTRAAASTWWAGRTRSTRAPRLARSSWAAAPRTAATATDCCRSPTARSISRALPSLMASVYVLRTCPYSTPRLLVYTLSCVQLSCTQTHR